MVAYTRLTQDQASQHSSMAERGSHEVPPLAEELLTVSFGREGQSLLCRRVTASNLTILQWMAPHSLSIWTTQIGLSELLKRKTKPDRRHEVWRDSNVGGRPGRN